MANGKAAVGLQALPPPHFTHTGMQGQSDRIRAKYRRKKVRQIVPSLTAKQESHPVFPPAFKKKTKQLCIRQVLVQWEL